MRVIYQARVRKAQKELREQGLKALLVSTVANRYYLSGFSGTAGDILVTASSAKLFVDGRYTLRAAEESLLPVGDTESLKKALVRYRDKTVGVEDEIKLSDLRGLKEKYKSVCWKETSEIVAGVRQQKDATELRQIRKGGRLIDEAFEHVCKLLKQKSGLTEIKLAQEIERYGREHGAQGVSFEPIVAWGKNSAIPHHASSGQKIGRNNFLLLDFGFTVNGYQSDFTRTLFIGDATSKQRELYEAVLAAQERAVKAVELGGLASQVDEVARRYLSRHGYGKNFMHNTGHGVGIEIHEAPNLSTQSQDILRENSVVTVEPGAYVSGKYGVRIEDMVLVGKKPKTFSRVPKNWEKMMLAR